MRNSAVPDDPRTVAWRSLGPAGAVRGDARDRHDHRRQRHRDGAGQRRSPLQQDPRTPARLRPHVADDPPTQTRRCPVLRCGHRQRVQPHRGRSPPRRGSPRTSAGGARTPWPRRPRARPARRRLALLTQSSRVIARLPRWSRRLSGRRARAHLTGPSRIRPFTVPAGSSSMSAIWRWVEPPK